MISEINGKIKKRKESSVIVDLNGICYEVMIPPAVMKGIDKAKVGEAAAEIRDFYRPEPYKGKGIKYAGEHVRRKAGKAVAGAAGGA